MTLADQSRFTAVLGPTNTGKTHLAIERMLGHASGMVGFPLRLLARENYDRIVAAKGRDRVALITGEERILPPRASWFVCTVESMPLDRPVSFLAIDEIQLCADPERGHIFTHRLLHARGLHETMVMGAETIRPLIRRLVPEASFVTRPRLSELRYAGAKKLTRMPARSAIVAFSAADVYQIAELIRRQRGGTAVVLGALSPRTRNAQMAMYQSGEVDYLVATDAIGMGLNMDVDHVAFARLVKFDGNRPRNLHATEIAQIAGRAGRSTHHGTFGTTDEAGPIDPEIVERVENHNFEALRALRWRNPALDFRTPQALLRSLEAPPPSEDLRRTGDADDHQSLATLIRDESVTSLAKGRGTVSLLWDVCQIPDFRKVLTDAHVRLQAQIFRQLAAPAGRLDTQWVADHVARLDRTDGDIDTLVGRIAHVRTWTYIAHRADWVEDPTHWQERTRAIEDALSDALHERLTQRFVDRRTTLLRRSRDGEDQAVAAVTASDAVLVDGEPVGRIAGFRFEPIAGLAGPELKIVLGLVRKALADAGAARVQRAEAAPDDAFELAADGTLSWEGSAVARLAPGPAALRPTVRLLPSELLDHGQRDRLATRLAAFLSARIDRQLPSLAHLRDAPPKGPAGGIAFRLVEALGIVPRATVEDMVQSLPPEDRRALTEAGVRFGRDRIYLPALLRPKPLAFRALLLAVAAGAGLPAPTPPPAAVSIPLSPASPREAYEAWGFIPAGPLAIRLDRLEALRDAVEARLRAGTLSADPVLARMVGSPLALLPELLAALGLKPREDDEGRVTYLPDPRARRRRGRPRPAAARDPDNPFAKLAALAAARG